MLDSACLPYSKPQTVGPTFVITLSFHTNNSVIHAQDRIKRKQNIKKKGYRHSLAVRNKEKRKKEKNPPKRNERKKEKSPLRSLVGLIWIFPQRCSPSDLVCVCSLLSCCCCLFGFNVAFNNFSVVSWWRLVALFAQTYLSQYLGLAQYLGKKHVFQVSALKK